MMLDKKPYTFDRVIRIGISTALIFTVVWLMNYLSDVLIPFAVALLLAYLINPLVNLLQRKIPGRAPAVFLSLFIVALAAFVVILTVIPMIISEIGAMGKILTEVVHRSDIAERASQVLPPDIWKTIKDYAARDDVQKLFKTDSFWQIAQTAVRKIMPGVWSIITGTTSFILGLIGLAVIGLYLVFLLLDYHKVREGWKELLPHAHRENIVEFVYEFDTAMNRYFRAQALVASLVGVLFAMGFSLIGLPMGILMGLIIGLFNMVPYLQILGFPPALLLGFFHALETGENIWVMLALTSAVFVVVQTIQDTVLTPKIMGKVTGLSPAMILLSLSVWGKLLGMLGLLIALPMTCLLLAYYKRYLALSMPAPIAVPEELEE